MQVDIKLDPEFAALLSKLKKIYGEELAKLNGFADSQLSYTDFIDNFVAKNVADASIDGNANVATKDICSLLSEMSKPHMKLLSLSKIFSTIRKQWGNETADNWLIDEYTGRNYLHDSHSTSFLPYCFAHDLDKIAFKGLYFLDGFNHEPPEHLETYTDFVGEYVAWVSNRTSAACGLPGYLVYSYYFWKKDCDSGFYMKSPAYYRDQEFQRIIYKLNQPYMRINQSCFVNFSIFDHNYLIELFGGRQFPDGSYIIDSVEEIMEYQKRFMEVLAAVRAKNAMTFPVMTYSLLYQDGKFVDEDFAKWCCKHNMQWGDSNFATFSDITSLSNCCRLVSDVKKLGFFNSIGGTAMSVGSIKVDTINLARIAYENKDESSYLKALRANAVQTMKALHSIRHIIQRNIEKGLLTPYIKGAMDMKHQYNTVGIIGIYETLEKFGLIKKDDFGYVSYTDEGLAFADKILRTLSEEIDAFRESNNCDYLINVEQIPGERAAAVLMQKDKIFHPDEKYTLPLYGNQWIPLGVKTTLTEKARVSAVLDKSCNGGAIGHFNIASPFKTFEDAWAALNAVAAAGCNYFAFNYRISICKTNHSFFGETCPYCGEPKYATVQRIVGFLVPDRNYSKERKAESKLRTYFEW